MQIELNQKEIETINDALVVWETANESSSLVGAMMMTVLCKDEEHAKLVVDRKMAEAKDKDRVRKTQSLLLRAKLAQASALQSEHEITPS